MLSDLDFLKTRILNMPGWFLFRLETIITIHSSYFQINQIKCIDGIIKVMQLNQIDWNSSDFLKTRIFAHFVLFMKHDLSEASNGLATVGSPLNTIGNNK